MFNVWSFKGIDALTASGLGGGSLIYANVMLRKDPSWFVQHHPYRQGRHGAVADPYEDLEPHYTAVEKFLDVQTFPDGADIPKAEALRDAARRDRNARRVPQGAAGRALRRSGWHVQSRRAAGDQRLPEHLRRRREGTPDVPAVRRVRCRMQRRGEEHTRSHLRVGGRPPRCGDLHPVGGDRAASSGRRLRGRVHRAPSRPGRAQDRHRRVVATCLGRVVWLSPRVRSVRRISSFATGRRRHRPPALGTRFCGNGDLLGFILKSEHDGAPFPLEGSKGPVISSYIRWPDNVDTSSPEDFGMYLEDAGFPAFMQWLVESTQFTATVRRTASSRTRASRNTSPVSAGRSSRASSRGCSARACVEIVAAAPGDGP